MEELSSLPLQQHLFLVDYPIYLYKKYNEVKGELIVGSPFTSLSNTPIIVSFLLFFHLLKRKITLL